MQQLDNWLMDIAGGIISLATFFGINRLKLIVVWIVVGYAVVLAPSFSDPLLSLIYTFWALTDLAMAERVYREDEILSNDIEICDHRIRIAGLMAWWMLSLGKMLWIDQMPWCCVHLIIATKILLPIRLWIWFVLNQSPKNPTTLRGLIGKLARILTTPAPNPVPAPANLTVQRPQ